MSGRVYLTPVKDVDQNTSYDDEENESLGSSSPRSFVPLIHQDEDISVYSDQSENDKSFVEHLTRGIYNVALESLTGTSRSPIIPNRIFNIADDDGDCGSVHSTKSLATASTQSLSQNVFNETLTDCDQPTSLQSLYREEREPLPNSSVELEYFEARDREQILVLGIDIGHLNRTMQFVVCASGVFGFNLLYGYLQELISVEIMNRQLGLFLAVMQFAGYTTLSYILNAYVYKKKLQGVQKETVPTSNRSLGIGAVVAVPFLTYLGLSLLRAVDLGMTNLAMQYINYPAKTLMKSSRVVFTMLFGVLITRKKYQLMDYFVVLCMVAGLVIFMHADSTSSAVFQPLGVVMLTISLLCDGAISNMSESIMRNYGVGQDEFIFQLYSIALVAISAAAAVKGDLQLGILWMIQPGTYDEVIEGTSLENASWTVPGKIGVIVLFSSAGFFGGSCSAAITKHFGALTMSITSTARKATTLFLSFFLFSNVCTMEHKLGAIIFISALTAKSFLRRNKPKRTHSGTSSFLQEGSIDLELQISSQPGGTRRKTSPVCLQRPIETYLQGTPGRRQNAGKFVK